MDQTAYTGVRVGMVLNVTTSQESVSVDQAGKEGAVTSVCT